MKRFLAALTLLILILSSNAISENGLSPYSSLESDDGIYLSIGKLYVIPSENEATQDTHGWIVIDAEIINFAIESLSIADTLSGELIYQGKYVFNAQTDFPTDIIQPLVQLKGRIIFEIPLLVAEAEPGAFTIELTVNGVAYPFEIPNAAIKSISMFVDGQNIESGSFIASDTKIRFEWTATKYTEEYLIRLEDWQLNTLFSTTQCENWFELDLSLLPPGDWYYFVVLPKPYFDLWTRHVEAYCSFNILKPTSSPEPLPTVSPTPDLPYISNFDSEQIIVYRTTHGKWYHAAENCSAMSGGKPVLLSECQGLEPCPKCKAPAFEGR